jgi:hypothetical protein
MEGSSRNPILGRSNSQAFAWRDWRIPRNTLVTIGWALPYRHPHAWCFTQGRNTHCIDRSTILCFSLRWQSGESSLVVLMMTIPTTIILRSLSESCSATRNSLPPRLRSRILKTLAQPVLALWRFAVRNFARTNFCNEEHTTGSARHLNANSLIRNIFRTKTETDERNAPQSVRLTLCSGVLLM